MNRLGRGRAFARSSAGGRGVGLDGFLWIFMSLLTAVVSTTPSRAEAERGPSRDERVRMVEE